MKKVIAAINMTLDGFCDHTAVSADDETHNHYRELLDSAGTILYGRKTFELMEFWPGLLKNPSGNKSMDEFAVAMDRIEKVVFSGTLKTVEWKTARLATQTVKEEIAALRQSSDTGNKDILIGSPSLIITAINLNLVDELQLCVHPVVAGEGLPLFKNISGQVNLSLLHTKTFHCGAIVLYYALTK